MTRLDVRAEADRPQEPVTVYEPHRHGLPPLRPYFRDVYRRRRMAWYVARADLKAKHFNSVFGQLWTVLNPLLLGLVYFFIFGIVYDSARGEPSYLAFIIGGIFLYYFTRNSINMGATSVVSGGSMLMNTSFPRALLPLSAVMSALLMYVPTLIVYAGFHVYGGEPFGAHLLWILPLLAVQMVFNLGMAMVFGALTVYFRDTSSFLPYLLRIWLYLTPIVYRLEDLPERAQPLMRLNPLYPYLNIWQTVVIDGRSPTAETMLLGTGWAILALVIGTWFFLSREREFAVRI